MHFSDSILGTNGASSPFLAVGYCDICIQGLTSGAVKLQYLLPPTMLLPTPTWADFPDGSYTEDTFETIFISQHGVHVRFLGVSNNGSVYVKIARHNNR